MSPGNRFGGMIGMVPIKTGVEAFGRRISIKGGWRADWQVDLL